MYGGVDIVRFSTATGLCRPFRATVDNLAALYNALKEARYNALKEVRYTT